MNIGSVAVLTLALSGLAFPGVGAAEEIYYLKDDASRWLSADGTPLKGARKASSSICHQDRGCIGLEYAGMQRAAWRQRSEMWQEVQAARAMLEESEGQRVELDPELGRALYRSAEQGYIWSTGR